MVVTLVLDLLRDPGQASAAFYGVIAVTLIAKVRPWRTLATIAAAAVSLGFVVHAVVGAVWPDGVAGEVESTGVFGSAIEAWVVSPGGPDGERQLGVLCSRRWRRRAHSCLGADTHDPRRPPPVPGRIRLGDRLVDEPSITRQLLLGVLLIVMMISRPHGLLGTPRVERV